MGDKLKKLGIAKGGMWPLIEIDLKYLSLANILFTKQVQLQIL